ncbi:nitronate monooxygenase family protein [Streptomyces sp. XD-27]|uniref:NAD(P)H-dependent flavin oxidoreductase n=1 Tax=Streptomyces sp. XD-27 TaxID=3062779 RepID=UPI0026F43083|nr:nitronate monooxygenase [Streptomyces sp. XD-27]WKX69278.1 nitronate monooxygenase [Streptomyces sp. XD-27]
MTNGKRSWARGRLVELLGIDVPIVQGPFGGGLSSVALASAVSQGGGLGSYGAHILTPDGIGELVAELRKATARPFAVNLWVPHPDEAAAPPDPDRMARYTGLLRPWFEELGLPTRQLEEPPPAPGFADQIDALLAAEPPVISFVMGIPEVRVLEEARRRDIRTVGTATTVEEALAIEAAGMDAVVASGSDAGGHRGSFLRPVNESLVGTFSLVPQVARAVSIPVVAAGGIADGRGIAAALTLGADGVQIGTGFLATEESGASAIHRAALHGPYAHTTVLTRAFSGRLARAIPNRFTREALEYEKELAPYPLQYTLTRPLRTAAAERGLADYVNLWSGQAAALTRRRGARDYLDDLIAGTQAALGRQ